MASTSPKVSLQTLHTAFDTHVADVLTVCGFFSKKTPKREIDRAKAERDDYLARKEAE